MLGPRRVKQPELPISGSAESGLELRRSDSKTLSFPELRQPHRSAPSCVQPSTPSACPQPPGLVICRRSTERVNSSPWVPLRERKEEHARGIPPAQVLATLLGAQSDSSESEGPELPRQDLPPASQPQGVTSCLPEKGGG